MSTCLFCGYVLEDHGGSCPKCGKDFLPSRRLAGPKPEGTKIARSMPKSAMPKMKIKSTAKVLFACCLALALGLAAISVNILGGGMESVPPFEDTTIVLPTPMQGENPPAAAELTPLAPTPQASPPAGTFAGGSGTQADPYIIKTQAQLNNVRHYPSAWYILNNDIHCSDTEAFEPICSASYADYVWDTSKGFQGNFNGNGKRITIPLILPDTRCTGLFGAVGERGLVYDLEVECHYSDIDNQKNSVCGAVAGHNAGGIINCDAFGFVSSGGKYAVVGGVVGNNAGMLEGCWYDGRVFAKGEYAKGGGIAGLNLINGKIQDCVNNGSIMSDYSAGGITSWNEGELLDCINRGNISATNSAGGVADKSHSLITGSSNTGSLDAPETYQISAFNDALTASE
ncbi:hypothetical protein LJC42_02450 [Eubacteriales bacterium OttesenSCG-928-K08]|nr:hypothetical protein [Eubacteriales bacterium OttesenSCG-928-K08]